MAEEPKEQADGEGSGAKVDVKKSGGGSLLHDRYAVIVSKPLPDLDSPSARAYAIEDQRESKRELFALICQPGMPVRVEAMAALKGNAIKGMLPLIDWGPVDWPPLGQKCMAVIYEKPLGGRLGDTVDSVNIRFSEYDIPRLLIEPFIGALLELAERNIYHRAIRPHNMFYMDVGKQQIVLGDCVTAPPGYDQPLVFETVSRAMAVPAGRGAGNSGNDLYALGVSMVLFFLGKNPVADFSDDELMNSKIEQGTYATLCGEARIAVPMIEPLRAILADSSVDRWNLEEMELWLGGRQMTPKQKQAAHRGETGFNFAGRNHFNTRTLARALCVKPAESLAAIKGGELGNWLRRSLKDIDMAESVDQILGIANAHKGDPLGDPDLAISKISIILDPAAPVRYRGLAFMPESFGPTLAVEMLIRGDAKTAANAIARELVGFWCSSQPDDSTENSSMEKTFKQLKGFIQLNDMGYGIERCLYELNEHLPCQSPLLVKEFIVDARHILPALNDLAASGDTKRKPMDRNLAAFIAARFDQDISPHLTAVSDADEATSAVGILSLYAFLHWRMREGSLKGLASWLAGLMGPAINTYHSRTTRREIERELPRLANEGNIADLFDLVDNNTRRRQDAAAFENAVTEFAIAEAEFREIENSEVGQSASAEKLGQQAASMSSVVLSLVVITVLVLTDVL